MSVSRILSSVIPMQLATCSASILTSGYPIWTRVVFQTLAYESVASQRVPSMSNMMLSKRVILWRRE